MKKLLGILIALLLFPLFTFASGKMILGVGETVSLSGKSDLASAQYKWVLLQNDEIIDTQTGQYYSKMFQQPGLFQLNLTASSEYTNETENSSVEILVGESQQFTDSLAVIAQTLPAPKENTIFLQRDFPQVSFFLGNSKGDIKEYRIDADIQTDSDGDGVKDNDIDNLEDGSFRSGSMWAYNYAAKKLPTTARLSVIDAGKNVETKDFSLQLESASVSSAKVQAIIETTPQASDDKRIHLQGSSDTVFVYAGNSFGNVIEYRIDTDIKVDSDGDGKTDNDIDNLKDASFKKGTAFPIKMNRALGDKIIQLIVVTPEGKGSVIQRKIVWDTAEELATKNDFQLYANTTSAYTGETVYFGLEGPFAGENYEIKWDFNGDKKTDITGSETLSSFIYDTPGTYEVLVQVKNESKQLLKYAKLTITVEQKTNSNIATVPPISNFTLKQNDNEVIFQDTSSVDENLKDKKLTYEWKFGDGHISKEQNPKHIYKQTGNFIARLKVTDSAKQSHEKQTAIEVAAVTVKETPIESVAEEEKPAETKTETVKEETTKEEVKTPVKNTEKTNSGSSALSLVFLGILGFFLLLILGVVAYLVIQKIKNPDYTFSEILEEEKEKLLALIEGQEYTAPSGEIVATNHDVQSNVSDILKESDEASSIRKNLDTPKESKQESTIEEAVVEKIPEPVKVETATVEAEPEWMKSTPVEETHVDEVVATPSVAEPVPEWMQDAPVPPVVPETPTSAPTSFPPIPNVPAPEWMNTAPATPQADATQDDDDDDIPEWLK